MTPQEAYDRITFLGALDGRDDFRQLVARVVCRLPADVRRWLLEETDHVFIGGHGQVASFLPLAVGRERCPELDGAGWRRVRLIFLSEAAMACLPPEEQEWTVAHEIAHSRLRHGMGTPDTWDAYAYEVAADRLVARWGGFVEPPSRPAEREHVRQAT